ncbi:MAG: COX15/CtaA family protein [Ferruginibacter sp.]
MQTDSIPHIDTKNANKQIAHWLMVGVAMIVVQVLIGGITRLTESGLSITEWKPITGILPPMGDAVWQELFEKYKQTDQFKYVHQHFSMSEFKMIFFWEWFHRVWARLMGMVFLIGFIYFLAKRKFKREMILPMVILFVLGGIQGFIGWIMVKSGLVPEKFYVGHIELTTHFIAALILLSYTWWFALKLKTPTHAIQVNRPLNKGLILLLVVLFFQLIYGGFMAGLKAAISAPTWPTINGSWMPAEMFSEDGLLKNISFNPLMIHFIHRGLGYLLFIVVFIWWVKAKHIQTYKPVGFFRTALLVLIVLQVGLGILTVMNATNNTLLIWVGVSHQFVAMLLVLTLVALLFFIRSKKE